MYYELVRKRPTLISRINKPQPYLVFWFFWDFPIDLGHRFVNIFAGIEILLEHAVVIRLHVMSDWCGSLEIIDRLIKVYIKTMKKERE